MKTLLALILSACMASAASLEWNQVVNDPSPATGYLVYRHINPAVGWLAIGGSPTTNFILTASNSVPGMRYRVTGTNVWGESLPSNEVTVPSPPQPPTLIIRASIETAPTPSGPWTEKTNLPLAIPLTEGATFARSRVTIHQ